MGSIAQKIARFINVREIENDRSLVGIPEHASSYTEAIRSNKWTAEGTKASPIKSKNSRIIIPGGSEVSDIDLLSRCIVKFQAPSQEILTVNDTRRWVSNTWKSASDVNVYEMNDSNKKDY